MAEIVQIFPQNLQSVPPSEQEGKSSGKKTYNFEKNFFFVKCGRHLGLCNKLHTHTDTQPHKHTYTHTQLASN